MYTVSLHVNTGSKFGWYATCIYVSTIDIFPVLFQTLSVSKREHLNRIPSVPGFLSYCKENKEVFVNDGNQWNSLAHKTQVLTQNNFQYLDISYKTQRNQLLILNQWILHYIPRKMSEIEWYSLFLTNIRENVRKHCYFEYVFHQVQDFI